MSHPNGTVKPGILKNSSSNHKVPASTMTDYSPPTSPIDTETMTPVDLLPSCDADTIPVGKTAGTVRRRIVTVISGRGSVVSKLSPYLVALRPWSFPASLGPVALGSCLAYKALGVFNIWIFAATVVCALSVHAAGNLVNTYVDFSKGVDSKKSDDRTLVDQLLSPADVATMGAVSYFIGCIGLLALATMSPTPLEHLALVYFGGMSASFLYTGGLGLKYIALGDVVVLLVFGPVTVLLAYISQGGTLCWAPLLYAIPLALNTEAILHSNNTRDAEIDREAGILTVAILAGRTGSYVIFALLLFLPYIIFAVLTAYASPWFALPLATVMFAFGTERQFRRGDLAKMPHAIASLNFKLATAFVVACALADRTTLPGF